jgi:hypothetical protein
VKVLGRLGRALSFCFAVRRRMGSHVDGVVLGATRYARPCRPMKPLLMIWVERARSERQRAQRRWEWEVVR